MVFIKKDEIVQLGGEGLGVAVMSNGCFFRDNYRKGMYNAE